VNYPVRPPYFANAFVRLLTKKTVANELGPQAFTLLTIVAMTEDARRYTDPVTFYNEQLCPLVGLGSVDALDRVRAKCVAAGWLHYIPGGRRSGPGRYWVTVPDRYAETDDAPTDEPSNGDTLFRTGAEQTAEQTASKPRNLLPVPGPDSSAASAAVADSPERKTSSKPKPRERNPLFDAVAEVTGLDPSTAGSHLGKVAACLSGADPPYTPDDVREFARRFLDLCPWARGERTAPTPSELQKYIGRVRSNPAPAAPAVKSLTAADLDAFDRMAYALPTGKELR
jgi:hypothetical protein